MPTCVCLSTGMIIIILTQRIRILRRSLSQNRETARSARCVLPGCRSTRGLETNCGSRINKRLCKHFFQLHNWAAFYCLAAVRLLLADQAVQFAEMLFLLALLCLEEVIHFPHDISAHGSADVFF